MHGWIEPFYERAEPSIAPGHIWRAQPVALPPRHALKFGKVDPTNDTKLAFKLAARTGDTFDHPPIHSLGLRSGEDAVIAKATRGQAVVVLGATAATDLRLDATGDAATVMVVPVYDAERYDEQTRRRVRDYELANAFYLPASQRPRVDESFARLDQTQPVIRGHLVEPAGVQLSADALDALVEWFVALTTNRLPRDSLILEYRQQRRTDGS